MELKRVVVTGLGAITPLGKNVEETWNALIEGKSGCGPITLFNAEKFKTNSQREYVASTGTTCDQRRKDM